MKEEIHLSITPMDIARVSERHPYGRLMVTRQDVPAIIERIEVYKIGLIRAVVDLAIDAAISDYIAEHTHEPDHEQDTEQEEDTEQSTN